MINVYPNHWYQFRLRKVLLAVMMMCVAFAWMAYSLKWINERHELLIGKGGIVEQYWLGDPPVTAPGCLWVFGEPGIGSIWCSFATVENVEKVRKYFPEADVTYWPAKSEEESGDG